MYGVMSQLEMDTCWPRFRLRDPVGAAGSACSWQMRRFKCSKHRCGLCKGNRVRMNNPWESGGHMVNMSWEGACHWVAQLRVRSPPSTTGVSSSCSQCLARSPGQEVVTMHECKRMRAGGSGASRTRCSYLWGVDVVGQGRCERS
jgi:hypothetical protein